MSEHINISPDVWGPHAWFFLDTVALAYPQNPDQDEMRRYEIFYHLLHDILPCDTCRKHYAEYLHANPLTDDILAQGNGRFVEWWLEAHNNIRKQQNKRPFSMEEFLDFYSRKTGMNLVQTPQGIESMGYRGEPPPEDEKEKEVYFVAGGLVLIVIGLLGLRT